MIEVLAGRVDPDAGLATARAAADSAQGSDPVLDEDLQLTFTLLYELHFRGIEGVDDRWEWDPALIALRGTLERRFEASLRSRVSSFLTEAGYQDSSAPDPEQVAETMLALTAPTPKPGLSTYLARQAGVEQFRELLITRSIYHLKEADPHSFAIPRLSGAPKAALVEIQADEYGGGRPEWMHAELFARTLEALGLQSRYGHYLDRVPAVVLATVNAMSLFGLNRRLRAAAVGHLAAFEMTSTRPNRLYGQGLRRLGFGEDATRYFDEHVEADAVHEQIALRDLIGALLKQDPALGKDVLLGAGTGLALDEEVAAHLLGGWQNGRSALRENRSAAVSAA